MEYALRHYLISLNQLFLTPSSSTAIFLFFLAFQVPCWLLFSCISIPVRPAMPWQEELPLMAYFKLLHFKPAFQTLLVAEQQLHQ